MGQKVHPYGLRLGIIKPWRSQWFEDKRYKETLLEDLKIRKYLLTKLKDAAISDITIRRVGDKVSITISSARPGVVIGRKRANLEALIEELTYLTQGKNISMYVDVIKVPELEAPIVAQTIASQIESRVSHRRAMKRAVSQAMKLGAKGIKVQVAGRLGGAELARKEGYKESKMPLHTIKANVDYAVDTAYTIYGTVGVKVWIYKGDVTSREV